MSESLHRLRAVAQGYRAANTEAERLRHARDHMIVHLLDHHTTDEVAEAAGVAQPRVVQIRNRARESGPSSGSSASSASSAESA